MEKKKMKLWKKVLIVILIIFLIFLAFTIRKMIIISNLSNKIENYQKMDNIYSKSSNDYSSISTFEKYYKDGIEKNIITLPEKNSKAIQFIYSNERKVFIETPDVKTVSISNEDSLDSFLPILVSYIDSITFPELLLTSLTSTISTDTLNGKECYVLNNKFNSNFLYEQNAVSAKIYIEKNTGLTIRMVQVVKEDNEKSLKTVNYEYSFGHVTDEDIKEPNISEYIVQENN